MIATITCYFNLIDHDIILKNYWKFRKSLDNDLFTIELSFGDSQQIPDSLFIKATQDHGFWQKERLLNHLASTIPPQYDNIAWVDADILFENPNWANEADQKLKEHPIVQIFEAAEETDMNGNITNQIPGAASVASVDNTTTGYGWAIRRELLDELSLLDTFVTGGSEDMMYLASVGNFKNSMLPRMNLEWRRSYLLWAARAYQKIQGNIGFIPGRIKHLHHGTYADREYMERWMLLSSHQFNPQEDIYINDLGIFEWASDKNEMHERIADYYEERKEDERWIKNMRQKIKEPAGESGRKL